MDYYVYIYLDPRKPLKSTYDSLGISFLYEPIYVGKGKKYRYREHLYNLPRNKKAHFPNVLRKIIEAGYEPVVFKVAEHLDQNSAFVMESKFIQEIGRKDQGKGPLLNFTDGGTGGIGEHVKGKTWTDEQREKLMAIRKEHPPRKGMKNSEEQKRKASEANKGRVFSEEHRKKLAEAKKGKSAHWNKGRTFTDEHRKKLSEAKLTHLNNS